MNTPFSIALQLGDALANHRGAKLAELLLVFLLPLTCLLVAAPSAAAR